ncbi:hypothetical protein BDW42DRAFT_192693 [Aspergillus taichungensis]|uniref:DUF7707 domain-containing protein n=1 Tax=Aspergillus taichungensis TaxID=482145 RepID=A0A2J5HZK0_9EURO|nr:hypothetical protein BDW42DRAFT_192693 [Aspergillus taichungensis]
MLLLPSLAVIASLAGAINAQTVVTIDPSSVDISTREQWCLSQTSSCPLLCLQYPKSTSEPTSNTCDSDTLSYTCVCDNGKSPNASEYSQTIPYFICTEENNQCVDKCNGNSKCQASCRDDHPCGAQDPKRANKTSPTTSTPQATTSVPAFTGVAGENIGARPSVEMGHIYAAALAMGAFLAGFASLL